MDTSRDSAGKYHILGEYRIERRDALLLQGLRLQHSGQLRQLEYGLGNDAVTYTNANTDAHTNTNSDAHADTDTNADALQQSMVEWVR